MEEDRDHLGNGSYHEFGIFLGTQQPEGGEEELIKRSCRIALRRLSTSSTLFVDDEEDLGDTTAEHLIGDRDSDLLEQDIKVGPVLGTGAFNNVMAIRRLSSCSSFSKLCQDSTNTTNSTCTTSINHNSTDPSSISPKSGPISYSYYHNSVDDPEQSKDKTFQYSSATDIDPSSTQQQEITGFTTLDFDDDTKYAMKRPRKDLIGSSKISGFVDLAIEAKFLSRLSHPHIVNLHGSGGMPGSAGYFIVVDRVQETLLDAITTFRRQRERLKLNGIGRNDTKLNKKGKNAEMKNDFERRVGIACQLASALTYLHKHSILFRDLKPHNIGLDDQGRVKMFDFGLAKELKSEFKVGSDQYKGSKDMGSRRYMAPEVYNGDAYGLPADVFSFAVVLWQLLSLQTPYNGLKREAHVNAAYVKQKREPIKTKWPLELRRVISEGWSHDPSRRPKISGCLRTIEGYLMSRKKGS